MAETLGRVDPSAVDLLRWEPDPQIEAVVASWPARWDDSRARGLGLPADADLESVVLACR
jgi:hypothetical protein